MATRHALVWLPADAPWQALTPGAAPRLRTWFAAGHPAVVARCDGSEPAGSLRLGVPLPPAEHKQRLALCVPASQVSRQAPPLALDTVVAHAPAIVRAALRELADAAHAQGPAPRVFGSFAWQALTGLAYVHAGSDLDLLWRVSTPAQADGVVALLQPWEHRHGLRADGELLLPGDQAVNWREYAGAADRLLAKSFAGCRLLPRASLFPVERVA